MYTDKMSYFISFYSILKLDLFMNMFITIIFLHHLFNEDSLLFEEIKWIKAVY